MRRFHQAREACEAARNLDAEIALNLAEMRLVIAHNGNNMPTLEKLLVEEQGRAQKRTKA